MYGVAADEDINTSESRGMLEMNSIFMDVISVYGAYLVCIRRYAGNGTRFGGSHITERPRS